MKNGGAPQNESLLLYTPAAAVIQDFMTQVAEISKLPG
jgi:hypothetical protein